MLIHPTGTMLTPDTSVTGDAATPLHRLATLERT